MIYTLEPHIFFVQVLWVNNLSHLRNVAIDEDTGRVDKYFMLALYGHGESCESKLNDQIRFPYPFAHNSDEVHILLIPLLVQHARR